MQHNLYYWKGQAPHNGLDTNFGDRLNWTIMHKIGVEFDWAPPEKADLVLMGSILEHLPRNWTGTVCGAGKMFENSHVDLSSARVLAVRGKLTAASTKGVPKDVALGEPALLAPAWFRQRVTEYDLGIIPHWSDKELWPRFDHGQLIDVTDHPEKVIEEITKCKRIITSSLHVVAIADAFGIPRRLELFGQAKKEGGDFKFRDYQSVFTDPDPHFGEFWLAPYSDVVRVQDGLRHALSQALGDVWETPPNVAPPVKRHWWHKYFPCNWYCRRPEISVLVPFRDDGEHRGNVWHWLRQYWEWNLPTAEIVMGTDHRVPFSKASAVNDAARKARGKVFVILDADAYMDARAVKHCADQILASVKAGKRQWFMPYNKLYRLNQEATLALLGTDPVEPYQVPHPVPQSWLEVGKDPSGGNSRDYGHRFGAMIMVMPREAFFMVEGMDYRMAGWGGEDVSFLKALDTIYCQHNVAANDLCHMWHIRPGTNFKTRRWVGQRWSPANSRLSQRYQHAHGEIDYMKALCKEHQL